MAATVQHRARVSYPQMTAAAAEAHGGHRSFEWLYAAVIGGVLLLSIDWGHELAFRLVQELPPAWMFTVGTNLPTVVPASLALTGLILAGWVHKAYERRTIRRQFETHAIPLEFEALYELRPDEFHMSSNRVAISHKWDTVDSVAKTTDGWVVSANILTCLIPHESFANEAAEREFVTALLARLTDAARERSADAMAFTTF